MTHVVRAYGPFRLQHGCDPGATDCMGPTGEYWTFMHVEVVFLPVHATIAAAITLVLVALLAWRLRGSPRRWAWTAGGAAAGFVATFLLAVWWVGNPVVY